jgi:hypothetical protein
MKPPLGNIRNLNLVFVRNVTIQVTDYRFRVLKYIKAKSADEAYINRCLVYISQKYYLLQ